MKRIFLKNIFIILILLSHANYSQNVISEVLYKKHGEVDLSKKEKNTATRMLLKSFEKMKDLEYVLLFNKEEALFKEKMSMESDGESNSFSTKMSKMLGDGNGIYYINLQKNKILHQREFSSKFFLVESSLDKYKWKISKEHKKIGNHTCYKATTIKNVETVRGNVKKTVVAWYDPLIPSTFGPVGYGGLPGLIVELNIGGIVYTAKKIVLKKKQKIEINPPKKGKIISEKEFTEMTKKGFQKYKQ